MKKRIIVSLLCGLAVLITFAQSDNESDNPSYSEQLAESCRQYFESAETNKNLQNELKTAHENLISQLAQLRDIINNNTNVPVEYSALSGYLINLQNAVSDPILFSRLQDIYVNGPKPKPAQASKEQESSDPKSLKDSLADWQPLQAENESESERYSTRTPGAASGTISGISRDKVDQKSGSKADSSDGKISIKKYEGKK